ncbi:MAG: cupin domain-containing protein [Desulfohalobium sp.]
MPNSQQPYVAAADTAPTHEVPAGSKTSMQVLISSEYAPHFAMRRFRIEPGGFMPLHTNTVEHEQYVLQGEAEIRFNETTKHVGPGDVLLIPAGLPHAYTCIGATPFEFLCLVPNQPDQLQLLE